jgi:hypothetical protein
MMMRILFIIQLLLFSLISCEKEENKIEFPVKFEFMLLDEKGQNKTEFKQGENFVFSFLMINQSDSNLLFEPNIVDDTWFNVYKSNSEFIGKPFDLICLGYVGFKILNSKDTFRIYIPWFPNVNTTYWPFCQKTENINLSPGSYYTSFKSQFEFFTSGKKTSYNSEELSFTIEFIMND